MMKQPKDTLARYLEQSPVFSRWPLENGGAAHLDGMGLGAFVIIPACGERDTLPLVLQSLDAAAAAYPRARFAVIVVVNHPSGAPADWRQGNARTLEWLRTHAQDAIAAPLLWTGATCGGKELPPKEGVGLARKIGHDWAARLAWEAGAPETLLLSLDADCLVDPAYVHAVIASREAEQWAAAVFEYAHRCEGPDGDAAAAYECHLRCYAAGLRYAGTPYAFHTIGSAMGCTAMAYAMAAGMPRRAGGEDFYFLQKLAKTSGVATVRIPLVYPSGRRSQRAPFGTGAAICKLDGDAAAQRTYAPASYGVLHGFIRAMRRAAEAAAEIGWDEVHPAMGMWLRAAGFEDLWRRFIREGQGAADVERRLFTWFDGFRTLKALHMLRDQGFDDVSVTAAAAELTNLGAWKASTAPPKGEDNPLKLVEHLRKASRAVT